MRLRSRAGKASPESLTQELETVRSLLDQGLTIEARARLNSLLSQARNYPSLLAQARCALSIALEMRGDYRESLEAVAMYEEADARATLDANLSARLRVQIALALNYNGDHPKAITLLKATLRDLPEEGAIRGAILLPSPEPDDVLRGRRLQAIGGRRLEGVARRAEGGAPLLPVPSAWLSR